MKKLLALLLFTASFAAHSVDVTITLTAGQATRFAAACGKIKKTVDAQGQPRACTNAESKALVIERMKAIVDNAERADLERAALEAIVVPAFDPQ